MKKYDNYVSNLDVLKRADEQKLDNEFIISGIKDKFCLQFELSWKLLRRLAQRVIDRYIPAFERMRHAIDARYADVLDEL